METSKKQVTEIWLDGEQELHELTKMADKDEVSLITLILQKLVEEEITEDGIEDAGASVGECLERENKNYVAIALAYELGLRSLAKFTAAKLIKELVIKSTLDDCPQCGWETEATEDGAYGKTWINRSCNNCDWEENNEPDFPDHKDYFNR